MLLEKSEKLADWRCTSFLVFLLSQKGSLSVSGWGMPPKHHRAGNLPARGEQHSQPHHSKARRDFNLLNCRGLPMISQMWSAKDQGVWGIYRKEGCGASQASRLLGLLCCCLFYILRFPLNLDSASTPLKKLDISDCMERDSEVKQNVFILPQSEFPHLCNAGLLWGYNEIIQLSA